MDKNIMCSLRLGYILDILLSRLGAAEIKLDVFEIATTIFHVKIDFYETVRIIFLLKKNLVRIYFKFLHLAAPISERSV